MAQSGVPQFYADVTLHSSDEELPYINRVEEELLMLDRVSRETRECFWRFAKDCVLLGERDCNPSTSTASSFIPVAKVLYTSDDKGLAKAITDFCILVNPSFAARWPHLLPYILEHEIFEAYLSAKPGFGACLSSPERHILARRHEAFCVLIDGIGEQWLELAREHQCEEECVSALRKVRNRLLAFLPVWTPRSMT